MSNSKKRERQQEIKKDALIKFVLKYQNVVERRFGATKDGLKKINSGFLDGIVETTEDLSQEITVDLPCVMHEVSMDRLMNYFNICLAEDKYLKDLEDHTLHGKIKDKTTYVGDSLPYNGGVCNFSNYNRYELVRDKQLLDVSGYLNLVPLNNLILSKVVQLIKHTGPVLLFNFISEPAPPDAFILQNNFYVPLGEQMRFR